jgi:threonylcarbamoyladenosine tRNA methylthiotransferase MtaB
MSGRVASGDLRDRSRQMIELGDRIAAEFAVGQIGATVEVLVEGRHDAGSGHLVGFTGNYLTAAVPDATESMINCIVPVRVRETDGAKLIGELGEDSERF